MISCRVKSVLKEIIFLSVITSMFFPLTVMAALPSDVSRESAGETSINQNSDFSTSKQDVKVYAENDSEIESLAGVVTAGGAAVGAAIDVASIKNTTTAFLGSGTVVSAGRDVKVEADSNKFVDSTSLAFGGGAVSVQGAVSVVNVGSAINGDGNDAAEDTGSKADEQIKGAYGSKVRNELGDGETAQKAKTGADAQTKQVSVSDEFDTSASVDKTTSAYIGPNAVVQAGNDIFVEAINTTQIKIDAGAGSYGVVGVGGAVGIANIKDDTQAFVDDDSQLSSGDCIKVYARDKIYNTDVDSEAGSVGVVGLGAAFSQLNSEQETTAYFGNRVQVDNSQDVKIQAKSIADIDAESEGGSAGVVAVGIVNAKAIQKTTTKAWIGEDSSIVASDDVTVSSFSDLKARAKGKGGEGGLITSSGVSAYAFIDNVTETKLGERASIKADDTALLESLTELDVESETDIVSAGGITFNETEAKSKIRNRTETIVEENAEIDADIVKLHAKVQKLHAKANAYSKTTAADSTSEAKAIVDVVSKAKVTVKEDAAITGRTKIEISARHDNVDTDSYAKAKISSGITGTLVAEARSDVDIDSDVDIQTGATLTSNDIYVEAISPHDDDKIYKREAVTEANTVVKWVLTWVDKKVKKLYDIPIIGWIVRWVWEKVRKWVQKVFHSDERTILSGELHSDNSINFDGGIYPIIPPNPILIVNADGTFSEQQDVIANIVGDDLVVDDIIYDKGLHVVMDTSSGTLSGNGTIYFYNRFGKVTLENNSPLNFRINDIHMRPKGEGAPDIETFSKNQHEFNVESLSLERSVVSIYNGAVSDIILGGQILNPFGDTTIDNRGGNIWGLGGNLTETGNLFLKAPNGSLGALGMPLNIHLVKDDSNAEFEILANHDAFIDIALLEYKVDDVTGDYIISGADINDVLVGDDIHMNFKNGKVLVISSENDGNHEERDVFAIYNIKNTFAAGGNIILNGTVKAVMNLIGTIRSGFEDIRFDIDANGNVDEDKIDYMDDDPDGRARIESMYSQGGSVTINGTVKGDGTISVLDGYTYVHVTNDSAKDLIVQDMNYDRVDGEVNVNGVDIPLPGNVGAIDVITHGYDTGKIHIQNNGASDIRLQDRIFNDSGPIEITNALGNILRTSDRQVLEAHEVILTAMNGFIGTGDNPILTDLIASRLTATAQGNIFIREINGDMKIDSIRSLLGNVSLVADASILSLGGDQTRVFANQSISLTAGGVVGTASDPIHMHLNNPGSIFLAVGGEQGGLSANVTGNFSFRNLTMGNVPPGLVLLNHIAVGGDNFPEMVGGITSAFIQNLLPVLQPGFSDGRSLIDFPGLANQDFLAFAPKIEVDMSAIDSMPWWFDAKELAPKIIPIPEEVSAIPTKEREDRPPLVVPIPDETLAPLKISHEAVV